MIYYKVRSSNPAFIILLELRYGKHGFTYIIIQENSHAENA